MGSRPRISVVVPTFRKKDLLACTLNALSAQTYPADLVEVAVVDDCSADGTTELLGDLELPFRLVALAHDENRGRAAARNTAIRAATGELVVFLDDDMRAEPGLLAAHAAAHAAHPDSAVIGNALTAPELGRSNIFRYLDTRGAHKLPPESPVPARYFLTNNASVAREALVEVGLFDEAFRSYGFEDTEIAFRLERDAGLSFWYNPDAVAYHIHHHTLRQLIEKRLEAARSSLPLLLAKHADRARDLSVEALLPARPCDRPALRARKLLMRALTADPARAAAYRLASGAFMGRVTYALIDYLIAAAYRQGLAESGAGA